MLRHKRFGFASLLALVALALTAVIAAAAPPPAHPPAHPKPAAPLKPAAAGAITMPDGSPIVMKSHGGVVLQAMEVQTIFIGDWSSAANQTLKGNLNNAVDTIVPGAYLDALTPFYGVGHGTHDSTVDLPQTFVNNTMADSALQNLIVGWIGNRLKPLDANRLYLFFLPPGVTVSPLAVNPDYGYHGWFFNGGQPISYAVINTSGSLFGATSVTSHEIAEAATDPTGQGYFDDALPNESEEIADFTDGPVIDGKQYPYLSATLNGVNVQLVLDPAGNVIQVQGATANNRVRLKPLRVGAGLSKPKRR